MTYDLNLSKAETYWKPALFIGANIALPHLFHLVPGGGVMFLPIYFFTLCAALCYGWRLGVLTAVMTPVVGYLLFGVPMARLIPDMLLKGIMLAVVATLLMKWNARMSMLNPLLAVVVSWGLVGLVELPFMGVAYAFQDFVTGLPGMAFMTLGGMVAIKIKEKYEGF